MQHERYLKEVPNEEITFSEWLVERYIELEEKGTIDSKLERLGSSYRGLWRSVTIDGKEKEEGWSCTIELNEKMVETPYFKNPRDALDKALEILEKNKVVDRVVMKKEELVFLVIWAMLGARGTTNTETEEKRIAELQRKYLFLHDKPKE